VASEIVVQIRPARAPPNISAVTGISASHATAGAESPPVGAVTKASAA
jgi:hypothetical protein